MQVLQLEFTNSTYAQLDRDALDSESGRALQVILE
jgi:hypothetical protein